MDEEYKKYNACIKCGNEDVEDFKFFMHHGHICPKCGFVWDWEWKYVEEEDMFMVFRG